MNEMDYVSNDLLEQLNLKMKKKRVVQKHGGDQNFDTARIANAIVKAFLACDASDKEIKDRLPIVLKKVVNFLYTNGGTRLQIHSLAKEHVSIQNTIVWALKDSQDSLMLEVGNKYDEYRKKHSQIREKQHNPNFIYYIGDNGEQLKQDKNILIQLIAESCKGIDHVFPMEVSEQLFKEMIGNFSYTYDNIIDNIINILKVFVEKEPNYSYVAARILYFQLVKKCFSRVRGVSTYHHLPEIENQYPIYFKQYIKIGIEEDILSKDLLNFDLDKLSKAIIPKKDLSFQYLGLRTLYDRYFIKDRNRNRIELPQAFFMRVAMGLAINETDKEDKAIEFYHLLSNFDFMCSTPTLFNSGTRLPQLSSCYISTAHDSTEGITQTIADNAKLSKFAGGIGNDMTMIRGMGSHITSTNGKSGGVIPFLKMVESTLQAFNQSGKRKGSGCAYLEVWHIDIEEFLELRKNTGDERRRTHDLDTAVWIPDLFMERVESKGKWTLFSPHEVYYKGKNIHELYGDEFKVAYEHLERKTDIKIRKEIDAQTLWRKILGMLFETGHPWVCYKDAVNLRNTQAHYGSILSSNLCTEITEVTKSGNPDKMLCIHPNERVCTNYGFKTAKELYNGGYDDLKVVGFDGIHKASAMLPYNKKPIYYEIVTKEGYTHTVTEEHKVWVRDKGFVETLYLKSNDILELQKVGNLFGNNELPSFLETIEHFKILIQDIDLQDHNAKVPDWLWECNQDVVAVFIEELFTFKNYVYRINKRNLLCIKSASKSFIQDIQKLLSLFCIKSKIANSLDDFVLSIDSFGGSSAKNKLKKRLYDKDLVLSKTVKKSLCVEFSHLKRVYDENDAYCLTVDSEDHVFTCNGIYTKNSSKEERETAVCNLGSINLVNHITDDKQIDIDKLKRTINTAIRMLDNVIDINFYPIDSAERSNKLHRPVGMGTMAFQDVLFKLGIPYDSEKAVLLADKIQEIVSYYAIETSMNLARERGVYSTFEGSEWSKGNFPFKTFEKLMEYRGSQYLIDEFDAHKDETEFDGHVENPCYWDRLRADVMKYGIRNSNLMAIAPNACVVGDTLILTSDGLIPISSLAKNESEWQDININVAQEKDSTPSNKIYLNGEQDTLKITTKRGSEITATPSHRVRVIDDQGNYVWRYFSDLKVGDEVVRRLGGHKKLLGNKPLVDLLVPEKTHRNQKDVNLPTKLDKDVAFMLGFYMGDGYIKYSNRKTYIKKEALCLALNDSETELVEHFEIFFKKLNIPSCSEERDISMSYFACSSKLVEWFEINGFNKRGEGSENAFIPHKILQSNSNVLCSFLSGLFSANCSVVSPYFRFSTVNEKMAKQIKVCLESLGILTTLSHINNDIFFHVRINDIDSLKLFLKIIGLRRSIKHKELLDNLSKYDKNTSSTEKQAISKYPELIENGDLYFEKIVKIEKSRDFTYDLQVPENNTYIANGFVSHNTISNILGVTQSIEPIYQNLFVKSNLSGEFVIINKYLVEDLKKLGLWKDEMVVRIKANNGSIAGISSIPDHIKAIYKIAFEIDVDWLIKAGARRQKWIDQSQSLNVYLKEPSGKKLDATYRLAWHLGLKTTYYLRTMGATRVQKAEVGFQPSMCRIDDPTCESCQ